MFRWFVCTSLVCLFITGAALAQIPEVGPPIVTQANGNSEDLALFVLPGGNGSTFAEAQLKNEGSVRDATLQLLLQDVYGVPVVNYPLEDLWLEPEDGNFVPCVGGTCPDQNTDDLGITYWSAPPNAGGHSEGSLFVMVAGIAITDYPLSMAINSADMNGDLVVDLADVGIFATHFYGDYAFEADFFADGTLNLVDVGRLALGLGGSCP